MHRLSVLVYIYSLLLFKAIYLFVMGNHIQKIKNNFGLAVSFSYNIEYNHKKEILNCFVKNANILPVHVLLDGLAEDCSRLLKHYPISSCTYHGVNQPSYYDMVKFAASIPHEHVVLSNADILFDHTIQFGQLLKSQQAYAISWSGDKESMCLMPNNIICATKQKKWVLNCWPRRLFSIDSFVFRRKDLLNIQKDGFVDIEGLTFTMNRPDAEFAFVGALEHQGIRFQNACRFIKTRHQHNSRKSYDPMPPLFTEYNIYRINKDRRKILKKLVYNDIAGINEFRLPLGISI